MRYEWDEHKNLSNINKHGIDFSYSIAVFDDEYLLEIVDGRKDYGEKRYKVIGRVEDRIISVVYTLRSKNYRIISAREARKDERQNYLRNTQER